MMKFVKVSSGEMPKVGLEVKIPENMPQTEKGFTGEYDGVAVVALTRDEDKQSNTIKCGLIGALSVHELLDMIQSLESVKESIQSSIEESIQQVMVKNPLEAYRMVALVKKYQDDRVKEMFKKVGLDPEGVEDIVEKTMRDIFSSKGDRH